MNNDDNLWQIEGYLLGDPTIDRDKFEQQMLDDPTFALQVAEVSEQLELLTKAARQAVTISVAQSESTVSNSARSNLMGSHAVSTQQSPSAQSSRRAFLAVLTISAALLIAVVPLFNRRNHNRLDDLALNWLALESERTGEPDASNSTVTAIADSEIVEPDDNASPSALAVSDGASSESTSNEDWLLDTAVIFFSDAGL